MTASEKHEIEKMRLRGLSYAQIAASLGLSLNTVKSFCRRHKLMACEDKGNEGSKDTCRHCGDPIEKKPKTKARIFCSDRCRYAWWNANRSQMSRKALCRLTCVHCGRTFTSYGNKERKYCGHACYIKKRFREEGRCESGSI